MKDIIPEICVLAGPAKKAVGVKRHFVTPGIGQGNFGRGGVASRYVRFPRANAVEHGYTRTHGFSVVCGFDEGVLSVEVRDFHAGAPWSAESKASHMGAMKSEGGLGLILIDALTDEWQLRPADPGGSILTFRIGQEHATAGVLRSAIHARG